jgi:N-acetyl-gamma-glutamyl-phosphate reductase
MSGRLRAIVVGATGYAGRELIRLLINHAEFELVGAFSSRSAEVLSLAEIHPQLTGLIELDCQPFDEAKIARIDPQLIFLATPNEFSHEVVPSLLETGATIIDLSGAFRLRDARLYPDYYGFDHSRPDLLQRAVFGLTEFSREKLSGAKLIANPGCYSTSILIPLIPLIKAELIAGRQPIICDSKSGVTGAGKTPAPTTHFVEVSESFKAYNLFKHRHTPEIAQGLGVPNHSSSLIFTPHLLPINRGILSTIYVKLEDHVTKEEILSIWRNAFSKAPLVRVFSGTQMPEIKFVAGSPYCDIGCSIEQKSGQAIIVSAIDNLLKGAASQALQNANVAFGFAGEAGLR